MISFIDMNNNITISPEYGSIYAFLTNCLSKTCETKDYDMLDTMIAWLPATKMMKIYSNRIELLIREHDGKIASISYKTALCDVFKKQIVEWNDGFTKNQEPDDKTCVPEISRLVTISTAHIKKSTIDFLNGECDRETAKTGIPVFKKTMYEESYGWFIYTDSLSFCDRKELPDDLIDCIEFANDYQASVLCLDSDGPIMPQLTNYTAIKLDSNNDLIKTILTRGNTAIEDFLGYPLSGKESPRRIENQMKNVLMQMPDDEIKKYREKYAQKKSES